MAWEAVEGIVGPLLDYSPPMLHTRPFRTVLVAGIALLATAGSVLAGRSSTDERPNVILVMADDLGYGDTGFTGNATVRTPNLDRFAGEGVRLDRFYAAAPVCSPTRASCLTGRHPFRVGITWAFEGALPAREITIAEALREAGYATAHFGKWHVGHLSRTVKQGYAPGEVDGTGYSPPWENGFEECFSVLNSVPSFNPYYLTCGEFGSESYRLVMDRAVALGQREGGFVWRDRFWTGPGRLHDEWLEGSVPELLVDRTLGFARRSCDAGRPFLALLWFSTPHTPVVAGPRHRAPYAELTLPEQHWFGAITAMDEAVGRLVAELEAEGIAENTLLWFCSDNGPTWVHELGTTGGLRGRKGSLWEGGIRVPAFVRWPAGFEGERTLSEPMSTSDLLPTALRVAGVEIPDDRPIDGEDVLSILAGESEHRARPIGFQSPKLESQAKDTKAWMQRGGLQLAWIDGPWKLVSMDGGESWELYDLASDPAEARDVAGEHPERVRHMREQVDRWTESCAMSARGEEPVKLLVAEETPVRGVERSPACYAQFREQNVLVTNAGRIVVVAQGREKSGWSDRSGQDLVCRCSDDHGDTWSDTVLVASTGDHSICPNAAVHDRDTDAIHVLYNVFLWDFHDAESRKAMNGRECRQFQVTSTDGGETWSAPRELTEMLGSERHTTVFGSGEGIQLRHGTRAGRLVVPGGFQHRWGNRMFTSDDHGETWQVREIAPRDRVEELNVRLENKVAELSDGTLVLNARHTPERVRAFSADGGESWTAEEVDPALAAVSCNGALLCVQDESGRDVLLCSVPVGPRRTHGTVYASLDGGRTWPHSKTLVEGEFAYSSLVSLGDGRLGLVYEARGHRDIVLMRFTLSRILQ